LDRNSIPHYCCPFCDEAGTGEERGLVASQSSNNNLTYFQPLQIPSTKSHWIIECRITQSTVSRSCAKVDKKQGTIIPFWNVTGHTETEASQSKNKFSL